MKKRKSNFRIPDEYYTWIINNHPDPDATLTCEFECYRIWRIMMDLMEKDQKLIEDAITEVHGFANWYLTKQGLSQEEIDEHVKQGMAIVNKLIEKKRNENRG